MEDSVRSFKDTTPRLSPAIMSQTGFHPSGIPINPTLHSLDTYTDVQCHPFVSAANDHESLAENKLLGDEDVQLTLQNKDMWASFNKMGTEMVVTKAGRRMFPGLKVKCNGMSPKAMYTLLVDLSPVDSNKYKYHDGEWIVSGKGAPQPQTRIYVHPDSPAPGSFWMRKEISFHKMKLTNNQEDKHGHVIVNTMQKYQPRIQIVRCNDANTGDWEKLKTISFKETQIFTVTSYQNQEMTRMKINNNPFARGFRDGQLSSQRLNTGVKRRAREYSENSVVEADFYPKPKKSKCKPNTNIHDVSDLQNFSAYQPEGSLYGPQGLPQLTPYTETRKADMKSTRRSATDLLPTYCQEVVSRSSKQISRHVENPCIIPQQTLQRNHVIYSSSTDTNNGPVMRTPELYRRDQIGANIHKSDLHQYPNLRVEPHGLPTCLSMPSVRAPCCQTISPDYRISASSPANCQFSPNIPSPYSLFSESCDFVQTFSSPCRYQVPIETLASTPLYKRNDRILNGPDSFNNDNIEIPVSELNCSLSPSPTVSDLSFPLFNFDPIDNDDTVDNILRNSRASSTIDSLSPVFNDKPASTSRESQTSPLRYDISNLSPDQKVPMGSPDAPFEDLLSEAMFLTFSSSDTEELKLPEENEFSVEGFEAILK